MSSEKEPIELSLKERVSEALGEDIKPKVTTISVDDAIAAAPLRKVSTERTNVRMLFITSDTSVLTPGAPAQQHYADLAQFVGEVHLMILKKGKGETKVERPMRNVWLYHVYGKHMVQLSLHARTAARHHLRFNKIVRPDVVVATDPFTSGVATWLVARTLRRPWQLHMRENIFTLEWLASDTRNKRKKRIAQFVLKRATSIRTASASLKQSVQKFLPKNADVAMLPHRFDLASFRQAPTADVHERYSQYAFIMFAEGPYSADSHLHDVFAAVHQLLKNKRIGLVVYGHGRAKSLFVEKAQLLGVTEQVVFCDSRDDVVALYQSADVFLEGSTDAEGDERILHAIAAATPVIAYTNDFRSGLLVDGESGFLCEPGDSYTLGLKVRELLNDSARRKQFGMRAQAIIDEQIHEDLPTYFAALRDTITTAIPAPVEKPAES